MSISICNNSSTRKHSGGPRVNPIYLNLYLYMYLVLVTGFTRRGDDTGREGGEEPSQDGGAK